MRGVAELDDGSLLYIFSKVGDAREVARLSAVCKRWRELRWSVSYLAFSFANVTQEELRMSEDVISSVLYHTKKNAPGSLKHLSVTLSCADEAEAACHWLVWVTGLARLQLEANRSLAWGPTLWNSVVAMDTIESFTVFGWFHSSFPSHGTKDLTLKHLRQCQLNFQGVSVSLLHTIFAACPHMSAGAFSDVSVRVASASLITFQIFGLGQAFKVIIDAPKLVYLWVNSRTIRMESRAVGKPSIQFVSKGLRELKLRVPCVLDNRCDSLRSLKVFGEWEMEDLVNLLKLTPMITEFHLRFRLSGMHTINIDNVVAPHTNLRHIHLDSSAVTYLQGGVTNLAALNVHLWPDETGNSYKYDMELLRHLLEVHKIRSLSVRRKDLIDHDVLLIYPDRVRLCPT